MPFANGVYRWAVDELEQYGRQSFGLVDIEKLREKEAIAPWEDSLAKKIETQSDLARTYIDYLLGRVVCCSHVDRLREHKIAITPAGMLYQGYVMRPIPKDRMEDAFIGRRAVDLRIARLLSDLEANLYLNYTTKGPKKQAKMRVYGYFLWNKKRADSFKTASPFLRVCWGT